jgi:curli biogenesis system outer membrane secretion channel CsgG
MKRICFVFLLTGVALDATATRSHAADLPDPYRQLADALATNVRGEPVNIAVGNFLYEETQLVSPFSALLREELERTLGATGKFRVITRERLGDLQNEWMLQGANLYEPQGGTNASPTKTVPQIAVASIKAIVRGRFYYNPPTVTVSVELAWLEGGFVNKAKALVPVTAINARIVPASLATSVPATTPSDTRANEVVSEDAMHTLGLHVAEGRQGAFEELLDIAGKLYQGIDYNKDRNRLIANLKLMHAAYDILGEQTGKGNPRAFDAVKRSLGINHLRSFAPDALGIAAAYGHQESLDMLLHYSRWGMLKSSVVFALRPAAEKNNAQAIDFLVAVLDNPRERALWFGASQGLAAAAIKGNPKAVAALGRYDKSQH